MTTDNAEVHREITEEEWIANFLARCEPLSQRQLDILTYEFQKAADQPARAQIIPTTDTDMSVTPD